MGSARILIATGASLLLASLAACSSTTPPATTTTPPGAATTPAEPGGETQGKIAVLLPDSKSAARWETADRVFFEKAFQEAGLTADDYIISNAEGDAAVQRTQADQAITDGAKVLLLVNLDNGSGSAIIDAAHAQGLKVIDYDRMTVGGQADYYVSGDATEAGRLQGQGLVEDLKSVDKPNVAILDGAPTDSFALDLAKGYGEVLDPLFADGSFVKVDQQAVKDWDGATALTIFEQILIASNNKVDGAIAANDTLANAIISALKSKQLPMIPVSGLDGEVKALQHILAGEQTFTVYFSYGTQAGLAANLAVELLRGQEPTGITATADNEGRAVPALLIDPVTVRADNIEQTVIADGLITWDDICIGEYAQFCKQ
ncbi:MAG: substrate-binding domain-containing protein [Actinobacteria bacterium]|nr:substrate-binding domain-containing protein [Actinomycetota bacterium]